MGLVSQIQQPLRSMSTGVKILPMPSARTGLLRTKNAQSAPSRPTRCSISVSLRPRRKSSFSSFMVKAALLLPPPKPAPEGMFLCSEMWRGGIWKPSSLNIRTTRMTKLSSPAAERGMPVIVSIPRTIKIRPLTAFIILLRITLPFIQNSLIHIQLYQIVIVR